MAGIVRRTPKIRPLAASDSIEQHGGADQKSRHRAFELDVIGGARTEPAGIVKPVHEAEHGGHRRQHEGADKHEKSAGFHLPNPPWGSASWSAFRENRPA